MIEFVGPTPNRWPGSLNDFRYRVDHDTESDNIDGVLAWFRNPDSQVSAQFIVGLDGRILQMADLRDACWHAGLVFAPSTPLYDGTNPNVVAVGVEFVLASYRDPLNRAQLAASLTIDDAIRRTHGVAVVPHCPHSALATGGPNMRRDPGDANFAAIMAAIQGGDDMFTDADRALAQATFEKINALANNIPFVWLERLAHGQDPATGLPLVLPPKHVASLKKIAKEAMKTMQQEAPEAAKTASDAAATTAGSGPASGQKGTWPGPGAEPVAPERAAAPKKATAPTKRGAVKKQVRKTQKARSGRKGGG